MGQLNIVRSRQDPLCAHYRRAPADAWIADHGRASSLGRDPFHTLVAAGEGQDVQLAVGIHRAVGGDHDFPNPGDLLCASLASCMDTTLRMIADRMGVTLETLEVAVTAFADVRGCLMVDRDTPVGFQRIDLDIRIKATDGCEPSRVKTLLSAAERSCVILQTLRGNLAIETRFSEPFARAAAE